MSEVTLIGIDLPKRVSSCTARVTTGLSYFARNVRILNCLDSLRNTPDASLQWRLAPQPMAGVVSLRSWGMPCA